MLKIGDFFILKIHFLMIESDFLILEMYFYIKDSFSNIKKINEIYFSNVNSQY